MHVFMLILGGGERLGLGQAEVFLVSSHCLLHDTSISRVRNGRFQGNLKTVRAKFIDQQARRAQNAPISPQAVRTSASARGSQDGCEAGPRSD
jgi:hypothetical protein